MGVETERERKAAVREKGAAKADLDSRPAIGNKMSKLAAQKKPTRPMQLEMQREEFGGC